MKRLGPGPGPLPQPQPSEEDGNERKGLGLDSEVPTPNPLQDSSSSSGGGPEPEDVPSGLDSGIEVELRDSGRNVPNASETTPKALPPMDQLLASTHSILIQRVNTTHMNATHILT